MNRKVLLVGGIGLVVVVVVAAVAFLLLRDGRREGSTATGNDQRQPLTAGISGQPLIISAKQTGTLLASLTAEETGISFMNELGPEYWYKYIYNGAGVAAGDYDGDGLPDLFLVNQQGQSKLYRNLGDMRFEDTTEAAGLSNSTTEGGFSVGAYFADIDNDGDLDLFLTNWKVPNRLFRNNGDGTFTDITTEAGVGYSGGATTATFADYDRDGHLDFFVATYRPHAIDFEVDNLTLQMVNGQLTIPPEYQDRLVILESEGGTGRLRELGERDLLYRNNGDGTFSEVSQQAGIDGGYWGLSAMFSDIDNDNWPDLYVTNDLWSPDTFYHNNGDGTFSLIEPDMYQHTPWFSMGVDFADINNDGLTDYFIGDMISREHEKMMTQHGGMDMSPPPAGTAPQLMRNSLYVNNGDGTFSDIAWLADVAASEWTWSVKFADLDLDGYVDLFITNGMVRDVMDADYNNMGAEVAATQGRQALIDFVTEFPHLSTSDLIFRNNGDLTFDEVTAQWGYVGDTVGYGAAVADFDGDGDLDIVTNNLNQQVGIFRNDSTNNRLAVKLQGQSSNSQGIGAQVTLVTGSGTQVRQMTTSGGYLSSHEPLIVFGLGQDTNIRELRVEWPSGHIQVFPDVQSGNLVANQLYTITEPAGPTAPTPPRRLSANAPQFVEVSSDAGLSFVHTESIFDDFATQMLLPRRLSTLGPGLAWGDLDGDGYDDLYIAGAAGQPGAVFRNNGDGTFSDATFQSSGWQVATEEMAPLWWHDGQGVLPNLLLSYSTVENGSDPIGARFTSSPADPFSLTNTGWSDSAISSSGALAAADFDGDGDLDLFVGGRVIPGQWPLAASSRLYANQNGQLVDVTDSLAPELNNVGMVTGALWIDVDSDNDMDLILATEFGPVHLFINEFGGLVDRTEAAGLAPWTGLWAGITAADFDGDGDLDLAVANLGLNTKYQASPERPAVVFGGDIDGDGDVDIVEAYYVGDTLFPMRYRGAAGMEMPFIMEQFDTYLAYAQATLADIYGGRLNQAQRLEAATLAHSLFINDGTGRFTVQPLPQMAQVAPAYGIAAADLDNDGFDDLYLVGNFRGADHETMAYDGGISYWLRGHGDGTFTVVPAATSGLSVPYEARGLAVADYDGDGWVDLVVGINNGHPLLFRNQGVAGNNFVRVRLIGPTANPTGVGARIMVTLPDGHMSLRQVQAGGGYLSQDSAVLVFGLGPNESAAITVIWPDGTTTNQTASAGQTVIIQR
jgi:enediyne biosynthesis protein E4